MGRSSSTGAACRGLFAAAIGVFAVLVGCAAPGDAPPAQDPGADESQWGTAAGAAQACGDGRCRGPETCSSCPADCGECPPRCGDGTCNGSETCNSCSDDCGTCGCNNNGLCEPSVGETSQNCPGDCLASTCGNGQCEAGEGCTRCPRDCGECGPGVCGDGYCDYTRPVNPENPQNCPQDCRPGGRCGDGICSLPNEDKFNCPQDCPCQYVFCPNSGIGTNCVPYVGPCL